MKEEQRKLSKGIEQNKEYGKYKVAYLDLPNGIPTVWLIKKGEKEFPEIIFHNTVEQTLLDGKTIYNCIQMTAEEFLREVKGGQGTTKS